MAVRRRNLPYLFAEEFVGPYRVKKEESQRR